jgi:hypothetical protein
MWCLYLHKKTKSRNAIFVTTIFRGIMCFYPFQYYIKYTSIYNILLSIIRVSCNMKVLNFATHLLFKPSLGNGWSFYNVLEM